MELPLIQWVSVYETRTDEFGLCCRRALFDGCGEGFQAAVGTGGVRRPGAVGGGAAVAAAADVGRVADSLRVVVIVAAEITPDEPSMHGPPLLCTPRFERLRDDSVRFTNFHAGRCRLELRRWPDEVPVPASVGLPAGAESPGGGAWRAVEGLPLEIIGARVEWNGTSHERAFDGSIDRATVELRIPEPSVGRLKVWWITPDGVRGAYYVVVERVDSGTPSE